MTAQLRVSTTAATPLALLTETRRLLEAAFDGDFSAEDWQHTLGGWHVFAVDSESVVSHAAVVPREICVAGQLFKAGYVEGVATLPSRQREGLASLVMTEVARQAQSRFELGVLSTGLHAFYARLGWERWQGPTFVRDGGELIRTEDEDGGIMALRFGVSTGLELTAAISCDGRAGDDW